MSIQARHSAFGLVAAGLALGCVPEFDDNLSLVQSRRIVGVRSVPAEAKPGETVELSVLIATPAGVEAQSERISWEFCLSPKPLTELGPVAQACIDQFGSTSDILTPLGRGAVLSATLPADGCRNFGPIGPPAGADGISGRPADPDSTGGYYQPVVLGDADISLASPRISCGLSRFPAQEIVEFNAGYRPNQNPELASVHFEFEGGEGTLQPGTVPSLSVPLETDVTFTVEWAACPRAAVCGDGLCTSGEDSSACQEDCASAPLGCTGAETYLAGDKATLKVVERREGIRAAWFTTAGSFANEQTARLEEDEDGTNVSNSWTAPAEAAEVRLWIVLSDDRGGAGWNEYRIQVRP